MIILKTREEIAQMRIAGQAVAEILELLRVNINPGINTLTLNAIAEEECKKRNAVPVFKNYPHPRGGGKPFPAAICASVNEEVVHGIPGERSLQEGDIISIDFGLILNGYAGDAGSVHGYDGYWNYAFANAGTYIIGVGKFSNSVIPEGKSYTLNISTVAAVPEPETYALLGIGLLGMFAAQRRKRMA